MAEREQKTFEEVAEENNKKRPSFFRRMRAQAKAHKATFRLYVCLRIFAVVSLIVSLFARNWETAFFCVLTLVLFLIPFFLEETLHLELPSALEIIILLFIFCAEILGEAAAFYVNFPLWDSILHTVNGFLCAAIGFSLADILNRKKKKFSLSPVYLTVMAFCFSMTIGVLWEFFEFFMDCVVKTDMQKDFVIDAIHTVMLDESKKNIVISVKNIARTALYDEDGNILATIEGGYLDVGVIDTMKDLILNFIGALVFSVIGYFYLSRRGKGNFAKQFIPVVEKNAANQSATEKNIVKKYEKEK